MWRGITALCERPGNTCTSITDNLIVTLIDPTKATLCSSSHFLILQAESAHNSNTGVVLILRYSEIKFPFCLFQSHVLINWSVNTPDCNDLFDYNSTVTTARLPVVVSDKMRCLVCMSTNDVNCIGAQKTSPVIAE